MGNIADIVEGCKRGDERSMRMLYDEMAPMAMGVCVRYMGRRELAQDVMQDGFVTVYRKIGQLKDAGKVQSWVYRVMMNACLDHLRRHNREGVTIGDKMAEEVEAPNLDPFAMEEVVAAIGELSPMQRGVFNLCEVEGYTTAEVAQRLGSSEVAVRVNLGRARKALREKLKIDN